MEEPLHSTVFSNVQQHAGTTYARALLGASEKAGTSEAVVTELESLVRDVFDRLTKFEQALASPRVSYERKVQMLDRALADKMNPLLLNFLKVVARRGRFDCIRAIAVAARAEFRRLRNRLEVLVRSAEPLDSATQTLVAQRLQATLHKDVDLKVSIEPEIVAGLIIRVGDTVYDGSVSNRLARLRDEVVGRTMQKIRLNSNRFTGSP
jgi:F-type H+-transporting ATPase subunit delta